MRKPTRDSRHGAAVVELAVTLPLFLLLLAGVLNVCQTLHVKDAATLAAYESGRLAARRDVTASETRSRCEALLKDRGITNAQISLTPASFANLVSGAEITIRVTASLTKNVITLLIPADVTVSADATVLRE